MGVIVAAVAGMRRRGNGQRLTRSSVEPTRKARGERTNHTGASGEDAGMAKKKERGSEGDAEEDRMRGMTLVQAIVATKMLLAGTACVVSLLLVAVLWGANTARVLTVALALIAIWALLPRNDMRRWLRGRGGNGRDAQGADE